MSMFWSTLIEIYSICLRSFGPETLREMEIFENRLSKFQKNFMISLRNMARKMDKQ